MTELTITVQDGKPHPGHHVEVDPTELDSINEHRKIARIEPATPEQVEAVLNQPVGTGDGRTNFVWLRLHEGTLILGVFPQGDTYMEHSDNGCCDFWP